MHQVIDRWTEILKPVWILTNLNDAELTQTNSDRALERLRMKWRCGLILTGEISEKLGKDYHLINENMHFAYKA